MKHLAVEFWSDVGLRKKILVNELYEDKNFVPDTTNIELSPFLLNYGHKGTLVVPQ